MTTTACAERLKPIFNDVNKAACGRALTNQSKHRTALSAAFEAVRLNPDCILIRSFNDQEERNL